MESRYVMKYSLLGICQIVDKRIFGIQMSNHPFVSCMRNLFFLFCLLCSLAFSSNTYAQTEKKLHVGFRVGLNGSGFNDRIGPYGEGQKEDYRQAARFSFMFGGAASYHFVPAIALQVEALFDSRGEKYKAEAPWGVTVGTSNGSKDAQYEKMYALNYLSFPVVAKINSKELFHLDSEWSICLSGGIAPAINVSSTYRYNSFVANPGANPGAGNSKEETATDRFNYARKYVNNGLVGIAMEHEGFFIELRYAKTLGTIYKVDQLDGYNMKATMTTIGVSLGAMF